MRNLNKMLVDNRHAGLEEIFAIPPQFGSDTVYRCIFGKGEHVGPYTLAHPS